MTTAAIREKLHDYIRHADDKKVKALYTVLDKEIGEETYNWWEDGEFVAELNRRSEALDNGSDKGYSWEEVKEKAKKSLIKK